MSGMLVGSKYTSITDAQELVQMLLLMLFSFRFYCSPTFSTTAIDVSCSPKCFDVNSTGTQMLGRTSYSEY